MTQLTLTGFKQLDRALKVLPDKVQTRVLKKSVKATGKPVVKAARAKVPRRHGFLRKAIGSILKTFKDEGNTVLIIGARSPGKDVGKEGGGPFVYRDKDGVKHVPANYAHLVELGTKTASAKSFLRIAFDAGKDAMLAIFRKTTIKGIEKEARKLAAKK